MKYHKYKNVMHLQLISFYFLFGIIQNSDEDVNTTVPFIISPDGFIEVFTDGACSRNGMVGAQAGIGIWFNHNHELNCCGRVRNLSTNNNAEIIAAIIAIQSAHNAGIKKLRVNTDSKFVIRSITEWIKKWKQNKWKLRNGKPVKNKSAFMLLDESVKLLESVDWAYVKSHSKHKGNELADELARKGVFGKYLNFTI